MKIAVNRKFIRAVVRWLLLAAILLYVITGFGITEYRIVESLTFGLLTKNMAFRIHDGLVIPSAILLFLHICFPYIFRIKKQAGSITVVPTN
jgi:hypothetical protein